MICCLEPDTFKASHKSIGSANCPGTSDSTADEFDSAAPTNFLMTTVSNDSFKDSSMFCEKSTLNA